MSEIADEQEVPPAREIFMSGADALGAPNSELMQLLREAKYTIENLRQTNAILAAKVEMIDLFACVLHTEPARRSGGESPDVAWALQKKIDEMEAAAP